MNKMLTMRGLPFDIISHTLEKNSHCINVTLVSSARAYRLVCKCRLETEADYRSVHTLSSISVLSTFTLWSWEMWAD